MPAEVARPWRDPLGPDPVLPWIAGGRLAVEVAEGVIAR